ncbi:hypothetical protein FDH96_gp133 [Mycobacterium phage Rey]|uniref:Uncharacterized protein n=1 Tax=Mycobacterium phage Rey TaxID=1034115 RepID=G1D5I6_9CAUD|nr:hypothetical protein FDH96_gp133 [Mycobacterium phage Rey]AEK10034.1 hypothetical protein PBI_REY_146 [Mycobacterium phage Rey]
MSRERLERRVGWALHGIRQSWGWEDSARQVMEALDDLFPGEMEAAAKIADLQAELNSMQHQYESMKLQLLNHIARDERRRNAGN